MVSKNQSESRRGDSAGKLRPGIDFTTVLANNIGEGVYAVDREGLLIYMNPAAEGMLGWKQDELLGKNMHEAIHFQRADGTRMSVEECPLLNVTDSNTSVSNDDDVFTRKDGQTFPVTYTSSPILIDGEMVGAVLSFRNITERKRAEAALQRSEQLHRFLAEAIPQQVWTARPDGALDYVNRRVLEYFDREMEQILGWGWQDMVHPEDLQMCNERWARSLRTGEVYSIEFRLRRAFDANYRWHLGRALPVMDADGQIVKWFGTNTDIEEQKQLEEKLAEVSRQREQMLEEVSTPVVPVWRGVLALPLIGSLDTLRMQRATDAALDAVTRTGAEAIIIDITGARIVDSHAVANLGNLVMSLKLIGAEAIVTGVGAHASQTLVRLGVDLTGMRTSRTFAEALAALIKSQQNNNHQVTGHR
jgi:PAS domain S-box-containing protein